MVYPCCLIDEQLFFKEVNPQSYNCPYTEYLANLPLGVVMAGGLQQNLQKKDFYINNRSL